MSKTLQLNIYLKRNNRGCFVFKTSGMLYRINNLIDALQFVANLEALGKAIEKGLRKECCFDLYDHLKKHWMLVVKFVNGLVALELWLQQKGPLKNPEGRFYWIGDPVLFRAAVARLVKSM